MTEVSDVNIHAWIQENKIKNEKGERIDFRQHLFLYDIYEDNSDNLVIMKAAQVGASTLEIIKNTFDAKRYRMDIIYTLPTDGDVSVFVGGKVNRIIANNPILLQYIADKDSIEQKAIGESMIYFRGTWTKKAAIMVTADRLVHDEKDSSKQDVVADYQARLQHSKFKQTHVFSHPSIPNTGVDIEWHLSDQKEWIIQCPHCAKEQYLSWDTENPARMSIDLERKKYVCKACKGILTDEDRRRGVWKRRKGKEMAKWSGYHISLLMAPWVSAESVIEKYQEVLKGKQTIDWFYNKVLGLPYAGSGNCVTEEEIMGAVTDEINRHDGRMVIGVDTGVKLRYVIGNSQGLLGYGEVTDYTPDKTNKLHLRETLEYFLITFPSSIMVIDQGGDIIGSRKLATKYPGRVFLCHYAKDRKTMQLIRWGEKDESGNVIVDRNRMMQLVIDEVKERRWKLYGGTKNDWYDYWLHWSHIYRTAEENNTTKMLEYVWHRNDRDDWVHATVYWRIGIDRFGGVGSIVGNDITPEPNSYFINADNTVDFDPKEMFKLNPLPDEESDWRDA
jgi:hypothetical protein